MPSTVIVHITNEDPIVGELEALPGPTDTSVTLVNPRRRDGKPVHYFVSGVVSVILPIHRITFIEVMTVQPNKKKDEEVVEFFREN